MNTEWIKQRRWTYRLAGFLLISGASFLLSGCPFVPDLFAEKCKKDNTAEIAFQNNSTIAGNTYSVVWNGATRVTLSPGSLSQAYTEAAGVQHTLSFRKSNGTLACTTSTPILTQCTSRTISCNG